LTQEALGSVHYISPEQAKGGHVDARSDIYSVGVVMYEMLTSRLPFVGESAVSVAIQHISAIPLMPGDINPDIPVGLEDITMHAMEPDLNLRFTTAEEMLNDLEDFRKNPSIIFNYALSDSKSRNSLDIDAQGETRVIPRGAVAKPDLRPARTDQSLQPAKRRVPVKTELNSDEYRTAKKRASNTSTLIGIFSIVVFIIAVIVFMWNFLIRDIIKPQDRPQITIPRFINKKIDDIMEDSDYNELFNFNVSYENSNEYESGVVFYQNPQAERQHNAPIQGKINIELVVSSGEEPPHVMPNLIGKYYTEAKNLLIGLNLDLAFVDESIISDVEKGYVIETRPEAEGMISRGNTIVIVRSAGSDPRKETVPDMRGSSKEVLASAFRELDLEPDFREIPGSEPAGTVLNISKVGQEVEVPATIIVYISIGPPEVPEIEEPTPEPPAPEDLPPTPQEVEEHPTEIPGPDQPPEYTGPDAPPDQPPDTDPDNAAP